MYVYMCVYHEILHQVLRYASDMIPQEIAYTRTFFPSIAI